MPKKHAILIANTEYRDGKLASLAHPGLAYAELAEALKDPARGAFSQVETLVNANLSHVLNTLDRFFSRKPADDILLVYVGAHGFVDTQGELFLALKESDRFRLKSTALMAAVLGMNMDQCPSPHKLLILDCRFHSPFQDARAGQGGLKVDPAKIFAGRGMPKHILLASDTTGVPANKVVTPAATSATQKLQIVAPKDFTRALAETFRTPSATGGRAPFTVDDWWNDAAAELKASKAEPPQRLAVGDPPVTILRGASLPRPEMAFSAPGGESVVTMPILPQEPEADWSRLSGIFPLEMFAPDLAPAKPEPGGDAPPSAAGDLEAPPSRTVEREPPRGDQTLVADMSFIEGADLVLRARQEIESATPADLSDPDSGTLESPLSTSPTLELPESPEPADTTGHASTGVAGSLASATLPETTEPTAEGPVRRPDATLFFDLRVPPDLSGSATLMWDRPQDDTTPATPSTPQPPEPLGPRDTFTGLRARLQAQEEEEKLARIKAEKEEAAQREKLDQWKARWDSRTGLKPMGASTQSAEAKAQPESGQRTPPPPVPEKPKGYQAKIAALQKTMYVPGPDVDPDGTTPPQPLPHPSAAPATPATPPIQDGLATVIVSKDQFLNTGVHKVPTQLTPGATIMVPKDEFYGSGTSAGPEAADGDATVAEARPARPIRGDGRNRKAGLFPKFPHLSPGGRKALLWTLAALAPVGLGLFLFFGAKSGLFWVFGIPGDKPRAEAPRTPKVTPRPALPPAAQTLPVPEAEPSILPPSATVPAPKAPVASQPPAVPGVPATPGRFAPKPVDQARLARLQADSTGLASTGVAGSPRRAEEKAGREARIAAQSVPELRRLALAKARQDSLKAARFSRDSLAIFRSLARKDSLKAARASRDFLLAQKAKARQDSLQQDRLVRDYERSLKSESETARLALSRVMSDSVKAFKDSVQAEALLRRSVSQALKSDSEEMRGLYNRFALGYPGLKGEVVVNLLVAPTGEIERGIIHSSSTGVKMFDQLVLSNVLEWKIRPFKARETKAILVAVKFPIE